MRLQGSYIIWIVCSSLCLPALGIAAAENSELSIDPEPVVSLLELVIDADAETARKCLAVLTEKIQTGEIPATTVKQLQPRLEATLGSILSGPDDHPLHYDVALLATAWNDAGAAEIVRKVLRNSDQTPQRRLQALDALIATAGPQVLDAVSQILSAPQSNSAEFRAAAISALGRIDDPQVAATVLENYSRLEAELQPKAIELLTQRTAWSRSLLDAIGRGQIPASALNINQVNKLLASRDEQLKQMVAAKWGTVRSERNPQREQVISEIRSMLELTSGDAHQGQQVFNKLCGQCHKIYGEGQDVGPDITSNGRNSYEQLLSNVFDPSLVIGADYQARTVITDDGRVLSGLLVEDNERRIVLKSQGGKLEAIPRDQIEELQVSKLSLMPEGMENQLTPQELADLFAYLTLDKPPADPAARPIPGARKQIPNLK
jgi:putative heme-binding domain-containing protein